MKTLYIEGRRNGYEPKQCGETMTVGDLIDFLENYNENTRVYLRNDNGYTYGNIDEFSFSEEKKMTFEDFLNKLSDGNTFEDICDEYGHTTCMVECIGNEVYFDDDLVGFLEEILGAYIKEFRHGNATIETTDGKYYEIPYEKRQNRFDELEKEIILFFNSNEIKNI